MLVTQFCLSHQGSSMGEERESEIQDEGQVALHEEDAISHATFPCTPPPLSIWGWAFPLDPMTTKLLVSALWGSGEMVPASQDGAARVRLICHGSLGHPPVAGGLLQTPHKHKQGNDTTIPFLSFESWNNNIWKCFANLKSLLLSPSHRWLSNVAEWTRERKTDQPWRNKFPVLPEGQNENPETH